jgi:secreted trypsin-like serine protease
LSLRAGLALVFLAGMAGSASAESAGTVRQAVVGGKSVSNTEFAAVGALVRVDAHSSRFVCTGTAVGPRLVLTAAHCVSNSMGLVFVHGTDPLAPEAERFRVAAVRAHPGFAISGEEVEHDIAVVTLAEDVTNVEPVSRAKVAPLAGHPVTLVGYGATSVEDSRRLDGVRLKNAAESSVDEVSDLRLVIGGADAPENCTGDSGGPALAEDANGVLQLIGVVSSARHAATPCEGGSVHMRVDAYAAFIEESEGGASTGEPGSCALDPGALRGRSNGAASCAVVVVSIALRRRARRV